MWMSVFLENTVEGTNMMNQRGVEEETLEVEWLSMDRMKTKRRKVGEGETKLSMCVGY